MLIITTTAKDPPNEFSRNSNIRHIHVGMGGGGGGGGGYKKYSRRLRKTVRRVTGNEHCRPYMNPQRSKLTVNR